MLDSLKKLGVAAGVLVEKDVGSALAEPRPSVVHRDFSDGVGAGIVGSATHIVDDAIARTPNTQPLTQFLTIVRTLGAIADNNARVSTAFELGKAMGFDRASVVAGVDAALAAVKRVRADFARDLELERQNSIGGAHARIEEIQSEVLRLEAAIAELNREKGELSRKADASRDKFTQLETKFASAVSAKEAELAGLKGNL